MEVDKIRPENPKPTSIEEIGQTVGAVVLDAAESAQTIQPRPFPAEIPHRRQHVRTSDVIGADETRLIRDEARDSADFARNLSQTIRRRTRVDSLLTKEETAALQSEVGLDLASARKARFNRARKQQGL